MNRNRSPTQIRGYKPKGSRRPMKRWHEEYLVAEQAKPNPGKIEEEEYYYILFNLTDQKT